ncbi:MAG: membrane dipeptidase [Anaerolineales bacterium]|nr:membrane dipeptidase [Anaerolineales bacterium]
MPLPLIVDAHEDLAWNILVLGRDYTRSVAETRRLEAGTPNVAHNGETLLGWQEYQQGRVAIVFGTLFAAPRRCSIGDWDTQSYEDCEQAHRIYRAQLDAYHALAGNHPDHFRLLQTRAELESLLKQWEGEEGEHPVGLVALMEGADGVRRPAELEEWWELGLRIIGLAWAGTRYSGGTREPGPLTADGHLLLKAMAEIGFTLDLSHMDEEASLQALDTYPGAIIASHANAVALLPGFQGNRLLTDAVIKRLLERDGIIGVVPYCRFLRAGWTEAEGREGIPLASVADHVDHICQMAGDARHVGLGSDFDGGFGLTAAPAGVDTIADLQKLVPILAARGYRDEDVAAILGGNWLRHLKSCLP